MKKNKKRLNLTFRVYKNGKEVNRCQTHSKRHFYNRIGTINWQNKPLEVYLRVYYRKALSNYNRIEPFWNEGVYNNRKDFFLALRAFLEDT